MIDSPECAETDVGLDRLAVDLKKATKTPTLSYIVPNACHDGGEFPANQTRPPGTAAAEAFLETVVPEIQASDAYKEGGLIAITSTQAPQAGPNCGPQRLLRHSRLSEPAARAGSRTRHRRVKPRGGGGKVGLLLISPFVEAGSVNETGYFNHYSLLLRWRNCSASNSSATRPNPAALRRTVFNAPATETGEEPEEPEEPKKSKESKKPAQSKRIRRAVSKPSATAPTVSVRRGHGVALGSAPRRAPRSTAAR